MTSRLIALRGLIAFHTGAGARVAQRNSIIALCSLLFTIVMTPDPLLVYIRAVVLGTASAHTGPTGTLVLALAAIALASHGVRTLTEGLGGWMRSLPASRVDHRRAIAVALATVQAPLVAWVAVCAVVTMTVYDAPVSAAKMLAVPVMILAAGVAAAPARRAALAMPLALSSAALAGAARWWSLATAVGLLIAADAVAGPVRLHRRRSRRSVADAWIPLRVAWRAMGWRVVAPAIPAMLVVAFGALYLRNNVLTPNEASRAARLSGAIAVVLWHVAMADVLASRRPPWPWARSLPWSARMRIVVDALALGAPAGVLVAAVSGMHAASGIAIALAVPLVALTAAGAMRRARERISGAGGAVTLAGLPIVGLLAWSWWGGVVCLALAPLALRWSTAVEQRQSVTKWSELHHDAGGDSLAWSAQ